MKAILRWPRPIRCSVARRAPSRLSKSIEIKLAALSSVAGDHDRQRPRHRPKRGIRQATGQHDQPVHAALAQQVDAALLLVGAPVPAHEQRAVAGAAQRFLDAAQRTSVERTVNGLRNHADTERAAARQAAGDRIRHEAELGYRAFDRLAPFVADDRSAIEDARHRTRRNASALGDHFQCHLAGRGATPA